MRNDIELIDIVIYSLEKGYKPDFPNTGMCSEINTLRRKGILSIVEENHLLFLIETYSPDRHEVFSHFQRNFYYLNLGWWFSHMNKTPGARQVRIDYLNELKTYLNLKNHVKE